MSMQTGSSKEVGLKADAVSLWGDFVVSIANVAPSSSVAFTLAILLSFAGHTSPLAVLVVGIAMFFVSVGYANLNRWRAHAGAPYVWVSEAVAPAIGIGTGLLNAITSTLANVGNITLAGVYLLLIIAPTSTFSKPVTWIIATAIMGVLVWLAIRGIRPTVWLQMTFVVIEYAAVISFVVLALIHEASHAGGASLPGISDFSISHSLGGIGGFKGLTEAAVVCGFLYLGWEATATLGEESTKRKLNPGRAMMLGTGFLTLWYTFLIMVFQGIASQSTVQAHGSDVLGYAGTLLVPGFWGRALPLAVLIAVLGTSQIQMVEPTPGALRDGSRPPDPPSLGQDEPRAPDPLARAAHPGGHPAHRADLLPGELVGDEGHRLRDQRRRHARPVHVLRHRAEQRVVLPRRAARQPELGRAGRRAAPDRRPVHGRHLLLRPDHTVGAGGLGGRGGRADLVPAGLHHPPDGEVVALLRRHRGAAPAHVGRLVARGIAARPRRVARRAGGGARPQRAAGLHERYSVGASYGAPGQGRRVRR